MDAHAEMPFDVKAIKKTKITSTGLEKLEPEDVAFARRLEHPLERAALAGAEVAARHARDRRVLLRADDARIAAASSRLRLPEDLASRGVSAGGAWSAAMVRRITALCHLDTMPSSSRRTRLLAIPSINVAPDGIAAVEVGE